MELFFTEREEEGNGNGGTRRRSRLLSEQALTGKENDYGYITVALRLHCGWPWCGGM